MEKAEIQALIREAFAAQKFAYVPYSHFHVGAAHRRQRISCDVIMIISVSFRMRPRA